MFYDEWDLAGSERTQVAARIYLKAGKAIAPKRRVLVWDSPHGASATQNLIATHFAFLTNKFKDSGSFQFGRQFPLSIRAAKWSSRCHTIDADTLLGVACYSRGVLIKKSNIMHRSAGFGVFASRPFGRGVIISYSYGSLVYGDLTTQQQSGRAYMEHVMSIMAEIFFRWADKLPEEAKDWTEKERHIQVVP